MCEKKYYVGIDLGGTFIKGGIVDDIGKITADGKVPTESEKGALVVAKKIAALTLDLLKTSKLTPDKVVGIGIGIPGLVDSEKGEILYSENLKWVNYGVAADIEKLTGLKVRIVNDANAAALGEYKFGAGKGVDNFVMLTLGTGLGSSAILDGKLYTGNKNSGVEIGHMTVKYDGKPCKCGRRGCLEAYCSATALIESTKKAMLENPDSKIWKTCTLDDVTGKTAFDLYSADKTAKMVVDNYLKLLSVGIINVSNIFKPQMIIIGGGLSEQGDALIKPLQTAIDDFYFGGGQAPKPKIVAAITGNHAGTLGAAALWMK